MDKIRTIREQFRDPSPLMRSTLDMLEIEIMFLDTDFQILFMNKAKRDRYPYVKNLDKCYQVLESYGKRCPHCVVNIAMETGARQKNPNYTSIEFRGSVRHINITSSPVVDEKGNTIGAVEVVYDVEELYQTDQQLSRLNKEYESVIYALSHDLRSPLVSIEGFLRKLEKQCIDTEDPKAVHCVDRIRANVRMMNDFVKVLLDTSRITTGKFEIQPVETSEIIDDVVAQFQERADESGAKIVVDGKFPTVDCDRVRMIQVFSNLVGNALAHRGDVEDLEIEIGGKEGIFWVRDNGPGIQKEMQDNLFEPFSQASETTDGHFGMGMNIVHKIIQKHGGETWIESTPDVGTTVFFTLQPRRQ